MYFTITRYKNKRKKNTKSKEQLLKLGKNETTNIKLVMNNYNVNQTAEERNKFQNGKIALIAYWLNSVGNIGMWLNVYVCVCGQKLIE